AGVVRIAVSRDGSAFATVSTTGIWISRYDPALPGWSAFSALDTGSSDPIVSPQLAINDSGTAVVIWTRITSTGFLHNVRICTASGCANPLTSISSTSTSLCTSAGECTAASIDRSGNAFVLYPLEIMDGGPSGANSLRGRRYVPGIGWGTSV